MKAHSLPYKTELPGWQDYLELCKPKVVALMLLTSVIGMLLATYTVPGWQVLVLGNLGIGLMAGSAAAINHVVDRRIDVYMARTRNRPVAQGKVDAQHALLFAAVLGLAGMAILMVWINALTAWLTLASLVGYAMIYTLWLKRATPQNIVIGGLAWTPPHFWALAIHRKAEYAQVGVPMLPVTHGEHFTKLHIILYTLILIAISVFPYLTGMCGEIYLASALILGGRFLQWGIRMLRNSHKHAAIHTFKFSISYLMLLFLALLIDHYTRPLLLAM